MTDSLPSTRIAIPLRKTDMEAQDTNWESVVGDQDWVTYCRLSSSERHTKISELQKIIQNGFSSIQQAKILQQIGRLWSAEGLCADNIEAHQSALASFEQAVLLIPDFLEAEYEGNCPGCEINAAFSAIQAGSDRYQAWAKRGDNMLYLYSRYEEAIFNYDQALTFKSDAHETWRNRGTALLQLEHHQESINSCNEALKYKANDFAAWFYRGCALSNLGSYESAIPSFDKALLHQPDEAEVWGGGERGVVLNFLEGNEGNEEAIAIYKKAFEYNPDFDLARVWRERAYALSRLNRYEEAIFNHDQALSLNPSFHDAWIDRGRTALYSALDPVNHGWSNLTMVAQSLPPELQNPALDLRGLKGCRACIQEGLKYAESSEAQGKLHQALGEAYRLWGNRQASPHHFWRKSLTCYNDALTIFTADDFPQERLEVLALLIRTHRALQEKDEVVDALVRQGTGLLKRILGESSSDAHKQRLGLQFASFGQATVDLLVQQGKLVQALETAEKDKNCLMTWLLRWQDPDQILTAKYEDMRRLLCPHTAIVYWHLSPDALTVFILRWDHQTDPIVINRATGDSKAGIEQVQNLENWLKTWNQTYQTHIDKSKDTEIEEKSDWFKDLPDQLKNLDEILQIEQIKTQLPPGITHLTLVPHRDLHCLPLHYFFSECPTTTLPSLQLGRTLRPADFPLAKGELARSALTIMAPNHHDLAPLYHAEVETHLINHFLAATHSVETVEADEATQDNVLEALVKSHQILHFNGHAAYNFVNPKRSALFLAGKDVLTVQDLCQILLDKYSLITLASCETALSGNQTITSEYVGITSVLLGKGIPYILSTLWTVESAASMVFMVEFYSHLRLGPVAAYYHSCQTLRDLSVEQLKTRYDDWLTLDLLPMVQEFLQEERKNLGKMDPDERCYCHPYYWAAFTLTGLGG
jgi:CHAT domain-containing protein